MEPDRPGAAAREQGEEEGWGEERDQGLEGWEETSVGPAPGANVSAPNAGRPFLTRLVSPVFR